jgi:coproporphyrinogen III oxidase
MKDSFFKYIHKLQDSITSKLEEIDGTASFKEDIWKRPEGGGGRTRVMVNYQPPCKLILELEMLIFLPVV